MLVAQGNLPEALKSFTTRSRLPTGWRTPTPATPAGSAMSMSVLSASADVLKYAQGDLTSALEKLKAGQDIIGALGEGRPRQRRLAARSVGVIRQGRRRAGGAGQSAGGAELLSATCLAIMDRLAKADPGNAGWQRDLSMSYNKVGDVLVAQGKLPEALKSFRASHEIFDRLAKADPGNAGTQRDLSQSHAHLAFAYRKAAQPAQAREALAAGRAIIAPLVAQFPQWSQWKQDLVWFDQQIAELSR